MYRITATHGFITNSSSCIHAYDKSVLDHPTVKEFFRVYEIDEKGYISLEVMDRGLCDTITSSNDQIRKLVASAKECEYGNSAFDYDALKDKLLIIFGDEYAGLAMELDSLLRKLDIEPIIHDEYN